MRRAFSVAPGNSTNLAYLNDGPIGPIEERNELRSALVGFALTKVDASPMPELLRPGDLILLASDGLDTLDDGEIASIVSASRRDGPEAVKDALLAAVAVQDAPAQDNVTVALIEAPGATAERGTDVEADGFALLHADVATLLPRMES